MYLTLIGPRGAGKSLLGHALAERVGAKFLDLDALIVWDEGRSINDIFVQDGEPEFRRIERELFLKQHAREGTVLATGGGAVLHPATREELISSGRAVLLLAEPDVLAQRIAESDRPSLTSARPAEEIHQILQQRLEAYHACAAETIHTDVLSPEEATDVLEQLWYSLSHHELR